MNAGVRQVARRVPLIDWAADARWLVRRYRDYYGESPRLLRPRRYPEKMLHSMVFDRNPLRFRAADKLACRELVARRIGAEHLVSLIGMYEHPGQIPWDDLPSQFMAKTNHGSGWFHAVHDLAHESRDELIALFEHWLSMDYYPFHREAIYRGIPRRIMLEQLLQPSDGPLVDYRYYIVHGRLLAIQADEQQPGDRRIGWFRPDREVDTTAQLPYTHFGTWRLDDGISTQLEQLAYASADGFDYLRVDFFVVDGRIYAGELTSYPGAGLISTRPLEPRDELFRSWEPRRPDWWQLVTGGPRRRW